MEIDGKVITGLGKGAYFIAQEFYSKKFEEFLGFIPFAGTLNIIIPEEYLDEINSLKKSCTNIIKPDEGFGAVKFIKATLNGSVHGAIVFPAKTVHDENYLEFISKDKLRDSLNLEDDDVVTLKI